MTKRPKLYTQGPAAGAKAPILIAHFEGAMDAGSAGSLAVVQLLRSLAPERVATFDTDMLIDYRSHRPVMEVDEWVTSDVTEPEIALDLLHDDAGTPILMLHGPEPDSRWKAFGNAIRDIVEEAGVEVVFSFHGLPAALPHTRPSSVHIQSTDHDMVPQQPLMGGQARFPAPLTSYLQFKMQKHGVTGVTLLATVPYYLSDVTFPKASSALLRRLSDLAGLQLPIGDLERGADEDASQVGRLLEINPDLKRTVSNLEQHFDSISAAAAEGIQLDVGPRSDADTVEDEIADALLDWDSMAEFEASEFPEAEQVEGGEVDSMGDAIGDVIESYLKSRSKQKPAGRPSVPGNGYEVGASKPGHDESEEAPKRPRPRHRAPSPWEVARQAIEEVIDEGDGSGEQSTSEK